MRRLSFLLMAVWIAGAAVAAWLTPVGPRDGWQPPAGQRVAGFLADGRTLATYSGDDRAGRRPLRLWDLATGEPRGEVALPEPFQWVGVIAGTDVVQVQAVGRAAEPADDPPVEWTLVPVDARTGMWGPTFRASPPSLSAMWAFADAGRTLAVNTADAGQPVVDVFDARTGDRRCRIAGGWYPPCLAADGRRLACRHGTDIAVFDVPAGREAARFARGDLKAEWGEPRPKLFSPDGSLLLDNECRVFDVAADRERYRIGGVYVGGLAFTADGATLIVTTATGGKCYLEYRDARTGDLRPGTRRLVLTAKGQFMNFDLRPNPDQFIAFGGLDERPPAWYDRWLAKLPGLAGRANPVNPVVTELIRTETGERLWRGVVNPLGLTPDGRGMLVDNRREDGVAIWDAPPRRPWRWMAAAMAAWTVAFAGVGGGGAMVGAWRKRR